ncbi:hypothetical protein VNI00_004499 [Paramarasmius palmivorus]|uniref:Uncharacterized protein n=1 Tax=Paramarasmius palmivorus TaxID=297713 RepID=A0AAW0DJE2_9AGAR
MSSLDDSQDARVSPDTIRRLEEISTKDLDNISENAKLALRIYRTRDARLKDLAWDCCQAAFIAFITSDGDRFGANAQSRVDLLHSKLNEILTLAWVSTDHICAYRVFMGGFISGQLCKPVITVSVSQSEGSNPDHGHGQDQTSPDESESEHEHPFVHNDSLGPSSTDLHDHIVKELDKYLKTSLRPSGDLSFLSLIATQIYDTVKKNVANHCNDLSKQICEVVYLFLCTSRSLESKLGDKDGEIFWDILLEYVGLVELLEDIQEFVTVQDKYDRGMTVERFTNTLYTFTSRFDFSRHSFLCGVQTLKLLRSGKPVLPETPRCCLSINAFLNKYMASLISSYYEDLEDNAMEPIVGYDTGQSSNDSPSTSVNEKALVPPSAEDLSAIADESSTEHQAHTTTSTNLPLPIQRDRDTEINMGYIYTFLDYVVKSTTNNYGHHNTTTTCETRMFRSRFGIRAFGTETLSENNSMTETPAGPAAPSEPSLSPPPFNADHIPDRPTSTRASKADGVSVTDKKDIYILVLIMIILVLVVLLMAKNEENHRLWALVINHKSEINV